MMRVPLLERNPEVGPVTLPLLVGMANAIERESAARYGALAETMERRGETEVAEAFRRMRDEERTHVTAVERWAGSLGERVPDPADFTWRLPAELFKSWDEVARSARLTPYRAFAIAVDNEQRAFALYSYLAAFADDPAVAAEAEHLALEELRHAALMRRWRREAWHRERRSPRPEAPIGTSAEALQALLAEGEAAIAGRHEAVIARLRALGDDESARLLEDLDDMTTVPAEARPPRDAEEAEAEDSPLRLLIAAQEPLEALSERLEAVMPRLEGEVFATAEEAFERVISRISRISLQAERRM